MNAQQLVVKEQIVKTVVKSGNGGAVWVPKDWRGEEVVVILPEKQRFGLKERIIHLLEPHLKDIISVWIYGSYARNEQAKDSDVDILVITDGKKISLNLEEGKLDVLSFPLDKFKIAIKKYPVLYYQIVREAVPLINASVLEGLKNVKIGKESFKPYLRETEEHLKSSRELLELDKIDGQYVKSHSVLYSAMLRLRGLLITWSILMNERFSNRRFKDFLLSKDISAKDFEVSYKAYRLIRDDARPRNLKLKVAVAENVLDVLEKELKVLEAKIYGK